MLRSGASLCSIFSAVLKSYALLGQLLVRRRHTRQRVLRLGLPLFGGIIAIL